MADPEPYVVSYSFTGYQAVSPDEPLPAPQLDVELANIATAIADLVSAVTSIRRADGALENAVVTWDVLDDTLKAMLTGGTYDVLVPDINPSAFATVAEAEGGVANDKLMTPLRVKQALDALRAFASQAEAEAGSVDTKGMSPLRVAQAITAQRALASQGAAEAAVNNATVMTPLRVKQGVDAIRTAFTGSASITWGSIAAAGSATQTITVAGAAVGDRVALGLPSTGLNAGLVLVPWVSAANTVTVRISNLTAGAITPYSGAATTMSATVLRF